jgi:hypothetical protein
MRWIKFRIIGSYGYIIDYNDLLVVLSITRIDITGKILLKLQ